MRRSEKKSGQGMTSQEWVDAAVAEMSPPPVLHPEPCPGVDEEFLKKMLRQFWRPPMLHPGVQHVYNCPICLDRYHQLRLEKRAKTGARPI